MALAALSIHAQNVGTVRGSVTDPSASLIPGASIQIMGNGVTRSAKTDGQGKYTVTIPPGAYAVRADAKGFTTFMQQTLNVPAGQVTALDIALQVAAEAVQVNVADEAAGAVSTDPSQNVGALVLKTEDLEFLPDDPDDLQADLQALAGPAAGPNGSQFFVDGFSGGQLPPKSSIREIRINSNPFSSEFDRPGFGRIEILTKPGTDKFHGGGFFNLGDKLFDSRNPFLSTAPPHYSSHMFSFNLGGPINKKTSFFVDFNNRNSSEQSLVNATTLDSSFNPTSTNLAFPVPAENYGISPRIDYQINATNTLVARYNFNHSTNVSGVSGFSLPTQATNGTSNNHNVQLTETAILGTKAVDETRVQIGRRLSDTSGTGILTPVISVQQAFTDGGSPLLANYTHTNDLEIHNILTTTQGRHTVKAGVRFRYDTLASNSTSNYNGTYSFTTPNSLATAPACFAGTGIVKPTSLDVYRQTRLLLQQGQSMSTILSQGCGPTQFSLNSGTALADAGQFDAGVFVQDDFRFRPNLTVSAGLRYEWQTNIGDHRAIAPRLAIAWAPGSKGGKPGKTVIRTGYGIFYDRFSENNYLNTLRYNGDPNSQRNYLINTTQNPTTAALALASYPNIPSTALLTQQNQALYKVDSNYVSPSMLQFAVSVDRQLPARTSVSVNFVDTRGVHDQRTRNINAYEPGVAPVYDPVSRTGGVRPYPGGDIYLYESSGIYKQRQIIVNANTRFNKHFTMQGYYAFGHVDSNVNGFPSNSYNTALDWGRAPYDVRHRVVFGGNVGLPFKMTVAPLVTISSAPPFNITTGTDYNGDGINNDRPSFATSASNPKNVYTTPWGVFNAAPLPGETLIPINYGTAFSHFTANLRLSRTFGWGERAGSGANPNAGGGGFQGGGDRGGGRGGGGGGPRGGGGFAGGGRGGFAGFGGGNTGKKYNLTLTLSARNALNTVNYASPQGALNSPSFGKSLSSGGDGFGGGGPGGGGGGRGGSAASGNRKVELQVRFQF